MIFTPTREAAVKTQHPSAHQIRMHGWTGRKHLRVRAATLQAKAAGNVAYAQEARNNGYHSTAQYYEERAMDQRAQAATVRAWLWEPPSPYHGDDREGPEDTTI